MQNLSLIFISLFLFGCPPPPPEISAEATGYIEEVLQTMEANSLNRYTINWQEFRDAVYAEIGPAQTIADTYPGIRLALLLLEDNHSSYRCQNNQSCIPWPHPSCNGLSNPNPSIPENIGYVRIEPFTKTDPLEMENYAVEKQNSIKQQDLAVKDGWIVDLRGNWGGNMYPMIAAIGPFFADGVLGYFVDPDTAIPANKWGYKDGISFFNEKAHISLDEPYLLNDPSQKVAVLIDGGDASGGEITAIGFMGRPNTRFFGSATCGISTARSGFTLSDGATLWLTVRYSTDKDKNIIEGAIVPDEEVSEELIIETAVYWLEN